MSESSLIRYLEEVPLARFHYVLLLMTCLIYCFTGMNVMLIAPILPAIITDWNLDLITAGLIVSSGAVGMFFGAFFCGILGDLIGRRRTILFTLVLMTVFTGLCAVAWDVLSIIVLRFVAGIGLGGSLPNPGVYISEYVPAKYRGRFLGTTEASWVYGALLSIFFPLLLLPAYGWRLTFLVAFIPLFLTPFVLFFMPESLRYLEIKGRKKEGIALLREYGIIPKGSFGDPMQRQQIQSAKPSLKELWSTSYRSRTALLWISWAVLCYTYHGIFQWLPKIYQTMGLPLVGSLSWLLIITLMQIPGYYSATFLLDRLGRKPVLAIYLTLAGIGSYLLGTGSSINTVLLWSSVISFFNLGAWAGLYAYTPELYPTRIRGTGSGIAASMGRLAMVVAPTLTPFLWITWGLSSAFGVFALAHIVAALSVMLLGIETRGEILEAISK